MTMGMGSRAAVRMMMLSTRLTMMMMLNHLQNSPLTRVSPMTMTTMTGTIPTKNHCTILKTSMPI